MSLKARAPPIFGRQLGIIRDSELAAYYNYTLLNKSIHFRIRPLLCEMEHRPEAPKPLKKEPRGWLMRCCSGSPTKVRSSSVERLSVSILDRLG